MNNIGYTVAVGLSVLYVDVFLLLLITGEV